MVEAALDTRNPRTLTNPKSSSTSTNGGATAGSSPADRSCLKNRLITPTGHHLTSFFLRVIKFFFFHVNMKPVQVLLSSFTPPALLNLLGYICLVFCKLDNCSFSYRSQLSVFSLLIYSVFQYIASHYNRTVTIHKIKKDNILNDGKKLNLS